MSLPELPTNRGGIVLCGGGSTRMGATKATLLFGDEVMLERVLRLLAEAVPLENIVVAAAPGQTLPELPPEITLARDEQPSRGPLEGLRAGLAALPAGIEAVYATGCDVPLLVPAFVEQMFSLLNDHDIAVPREDEYHHPLSAVYRRSVLPTIERLLATNHLRTQYLLAECRTLEVPAEELRAVDPDLDTLANLNRPADYKAALARAGLSRKECE